jgi:hypothetical protein
MLYKKKPNILYTDYSSIEESDWLMKKEEAPILKPIPSFSSCLDQARNILFPNIFLKLNIYILNSNKSKQNVITYCIHMYL